MKVLLEFEDELDTGDLVDNTKVYGLRGTDEIHRRRWLAGPVTNLFHVESRFFLLKQNPHGYWVFLLRFSIPHRLHNTRNDLDLLAVVREHTLNPGPAQGNDFFWN